MKRSLTLSAAACIAVAGLAAPAAQAAVPTGPKTVPFVRPLALHSKGKDVARLQSALVRAHMRPSFRKSTGQFGSITRYEVRRWQRLRHIQPTGVVGRPTKWSLWSHYTPYARSVEVRAAAWHTHMIAVQKARAAALAKLHATYAFRVLEAVRRSQALSYTMAYSQSWTRTNLPAFPSVPRATDCSGYAIWVQRHAGVGLPMGWTGTLGVEGTRVWNPSPSNMRVGDLVLYDRYPHGHVEVYIGGGKTAGHGSPGIHVHPWNYRYVGQVRRFHA